MTSSTVEGSHHRVEMYSNDTFVVTLAYTKESDGTSKDLTGASVVAKATDLSGSSTTLSATISSDKCLVTLPSGLSAGLYTITVEIALGTEVQTAEFYLAVRASV